MGAHISSQAPALAAILLGEVESEDGTQGGVALSPSAVGALVLGMANCIARSSNSGSALWRVSCALCRTQCAGETFVCTSGQWLHTALNHPSTLPPHLPICRPKLYALSRVSVADSNKPLLVAEGDTRMLDTCATVLTWGTPDGPVDGGGGRWSPLMVRRGQAHCWGGPKAATHSLGPKHEYPSPPAPLLGPKWFPSPS